MVCHLGSWVAGALLLALLACIIRIQWLTIAKEWQFLGASWGCVWVVHCRGVTFLLTGGRAPTEVKVRYIPMFAQRLVEQRPCL